MKNYTLLFSNFDSVMPGKKLTQYVNYFEKIHPLQILDEPIEMKIWKVNYTYNIMRNNKKVCKEGSKFFISDLKCTSESAKDSFFDWSSSLGNRKSIKQIKWDFKITSLVCMGSLVFNPHKDVYLNEEETLKFNNLKSIQKFIYLCDASKDINKDILIDTHSEQFLNYRLGFEISIIKAKFSYETKEKNKKCKSKYALAVSFKEKQITLNEIKEKFKAYILNEKKAKQQSYVQIHDVAYDHTVLVA